MVLTLMNVACFQVKIGAVSLFSGVGGLELGLQGPA